VSELTSIYDALEPLLTKRGWFVEVVHTVRGRALYIRAFYPGADGIGSNVEAWINIGGRSVSAMETRGTHTYWPESEEYGPFKGRGWRERLIERVMETAKRLGGIDPEEVELPFDLDAIPIREFASMPKDELRAFVLGVADCQIFTSDHVHNTTDTSLLGMIFMPLALGALEVDEGFRAMLPNQPEGPGDKPETPKLELPDKPENTVREPSYPVEPTEGLPSPEVVPQDVLDAVDWGEIGWEEVEAYREGRGAYGEKMAQWQAEVWLPWKTTCDDLRAKHQEDIAAYEAQVAAWKAQCQPLREEHEAKLASLQSDMEAWAKADREYRKAYLVWERIIGVAYQHHFQNLGVFWEWMKDAGPRSVNGYPIFFSCRIMNRTDWLRARDAIIREQERRESIEI